MGVSTRVESSEEKISSAEFRAWVIWAFWTMSLADLCGSIFRSVNTRRLYRSNSVVMVSLTSS